MFERRTLLRAAAGIVQGLLFRPAAGASAHPHALPWWLAGERADPAAAPAGSVAARAQDGENRAPIRVSVHAPGGDHFRGSATVVLTDEVSGQEIVLTREEGADLFTGVVEPGTYELSAAGNGWVAWDRPVVVTDRGKTASAYLGEPDWPAYRLGENIIPFEPHEDLIAVAFEVNAPEPSEALRMIEMLSGEFPVAPFQPDSDNELPFIAANWAIWLFQLTDFAQREDVLTEIPRYLMDQAQLSARAGMPVDLTPGQVKVLDNQFVVRFNDNLFSPAEIDEKIASANATIRRRFVQSPNARLIVFQSGGYREHLEWIEFWIGQGWLKYGEPDLISEIVDTAFPQTKPNDTSYGKQDHIALQSIEEAWRFLSACPGCAPDLTLGSPAVYVATLDMGMQRDHPDIGGLPLSDGSDQLAHCFDFPAMLPCEDGCGCGTKHGMGVYGIIAARTDNGALIAGIAPNAHQINIKRPSLDTAIYKDVLIWLGGAVTGNREINDPPGWPAEPIAHPADVINCSHEVTNLAMAGLMDETLTYLTDLGRGGLGTIVVYGSGNSGKCITGTSTWAAHDSTMAIGNTDPPDDETPEVINRRSNYGYELDLCARGQGVWSLNNVGDDEAFSGTSAAAPTVSAVAALMLSVKPTLRWDEVRLILCDEADEIDAAATGNAVWVDGFSQKYGYGRLNAETAVKAAHAFVP